LTAKIVLYFISTACKTVGGNFPDRPCVFPFIFEGKTYHECTEMVADKNGYSLPQCPTKNEFIVNSTIYHWGNCGPGCPGSPDKVLNTGMGRYLKIMYNNTRRQLYQDVQFKFILECKTKTWGSSCKFPFVQHGITYRGCTTNGKHGKWPLWCGIKFTGCALETSVIRRCTGITYPDGTKDEMCYYPNSMGNSIGIGVCANWDYCQNSDECKGNYNIIIIIIL